MVRLQPLRLLLIADPETDLGAHQRLLSKGAALFHLTTAADSSPLLRGRRFDCVLLDGAARAPLAAQIRRHHPRVAVVLLTEGDPVEVADRVGVVARSTLSEW